MNYKIGDIVEFTTKESGPVTLTGMIVSVKAAYRTAFVGLGKTKYVIKVLNDDGSYYQFDSIFVEDIIAVVDEEEIRTRIVVKLRAELINPLSYGV